MTLILNNIGLEQSFSEAVFTRDVAEFLGVLETQVIVLFVKPGSVVVDLKVEPLPGESVLSEEFIAVAEIHCAADGITLPDFGAVSMGDCTFPSQDSKKSDDFFDNVLNLVLVVAGSVFFCCCCCGSVVLIHYKRKLLYTTMPASKELPDIRTARIVDPETM